MEDRCCRSPLPVWRVGGRDAPLRPALLGRPVLLGRPDEVGER
ncbi:MAG: hypothetical protein ACYTF2_12970 [Planctomycetota bacterium]